MPQLNLTKGHGCGVDVLVIESGPDAVADDAGLKVLIQRLCDRRGPLGAEAAYFVDLDAAAVEPDVWCFAPDGGAARATAYGLGVVGRVVLDRQALDGVVLRVAGERFPVRRAAESDEGVQRLAVEMPAISREASGHAVGEIIPGFSDRRPVSSLEVPEPQLVSIVGRYDEDELIEVGRRVEAVRGSFPSCPDISFLMPLDDEGEVFVRTYEYGVGLSRSSAAGVAAARAAYSRLGIVPPDASVLVRTPGGPVRTALRVDGDSWRPVLETNATLTYTADLDTELLASPLPIRLDLQANLGEVMAYAAFRSANARALAAAGVSYSAP